MVRQHQQWRTAAQFKAKKGEGGGETDFDYAVVLEVGGGVHVLLEVEVEVLEDEVDALVVVHDVLQPARQRERISSG